MALGAGRSEVIRNVLRRAMLLVCAGIVLGVAGALALTRLLGSLVYDVSVADPETFAIAAAFLPWLPPRRAFSRPYARAVSIPSKRCGMS